MEHYGQPPVPDDGDGQIVREELCKSGGVDAALPAPNDNQQWAGLLAKSYDCEQVWTA
jgi:hypothetical protein